MSGLPIFNGCQHDGVRRDRTFDASIPNARPSREESSSTNALSDHVAKEIIHTGYKAVLRLAVLSLHNSPFVIDVMRIVQIMRSICIMKHGCFAVG